MNSFQHLPPKNRCTLKIQDPLNAGKSHPSIGSKTGSRNEFGMTLNRGPEQDPKQEAPSRIPEQGNFRAG